MFHSLFLAGALALGTVITGASGATSQQQTDVTVYVTKTGDHYHRAGCGSLSKSQIARKLSAAKAAGYIPCKRCKPPR